MAGDVFLLFPGFFIPGLVSFLVAHLFYVALFKSGQAWFPHRGALVTTLGVGTAMFAFLWLGGLPPALRVPVAAYVLVIALMAAQAIGRATVLRDAPSLLVAMGAGFFMLSDSLLATNRFVTPLPMAQVWVLSTYYIAQALIVSGWLAGRPSTTANAAPRTAAQGASSNPAEAPSPTHTAA
jgi:alkylglycerol monooxygenase